MRALIVISNDSRGNDDGIAFASALLLFSRPIFSLPPIHSVVYPPRWGRVVFSAFPSINAVTLDDSRVDARYPIRRSRFPSFGKETRTDTGI